MNTRTRVTAVPALLLASALAFLPRVATSVSAQDQATPESGLANLGLPALDTTATASGYEGIPEQLEAGATCCP